MTEQANTEAGREALLRAARDKGISTKDEDAAIKEFLHTTWKGEVDRSAGVPPHIHIVTEAEASRLKEGTTAIASAVKAATGQRGK